MTSLREEAETRIENKLELKPAGAKHLADYAYTLAKDFSPEVRMMKSLILSAINDIMTLRKLFDDELTRLTEEARQEEREACAQVAESHVCDTGCESTGECFYCDRIIAKAIRNRSNK